MVCGSGGSRHGRGTREQMVEVVECNRFRDARGLEDWLVNRGIQAQLWRAGAAAELFEEVTRGVCCLELRYSKESGEREAFRVRHFLRAQVFSPESKPAGNFLFKKWEQCAGEQRQERNELMTAPLFRSELPLGPSPIAQCERVVNTFLRRIEDWHFKAEEGSGASRFDFAALHRAHGGVLSCKVLDTHCERPLPSLNFPGLFDEDRVHMCEVVCRDLPSGSFTSVRYSEANDVPYRPPEEFISFTDADGDEVWLLLNPQARPVRYDLYVNGELVLRRVRVEPNVVCDDAGQEYTVRGSPIGSWPSTWKIPVRQVASDDGVKAFDLVAVLAKAAASAELAEPHLHPEGQRPPPVAPALHSASGWTWTSVTGALGEQLRCVNVLSVQRDTMRTRWKDFSTVSNELSDSLAESLGVLEESRGKGDGERIKAADLLDVLRRSLDAATRTAASRQALANSSASSYSHPKIQSFVRSRAQAANKIAAGFQVAADTELIADENAEPSPRSGSDDDDDD